jgi:hypothetical protein
MSEALNLVSSTRHCSPGFLNLFLYYPSSPRRGGQTLVRKLQHGALLDIDQGPLYDILTESLKLEDGCLLDSALCNKKRRPEFLVLISTKALLFNRELIDVLESFHAESIKYRALGAAALKWILKKGIHLAALRLPASIYIMYSAELQSIRDAVASLALNGRFDKLETISLSGFLHQRR